MSISSNVNGVIKTAMPMYTPFKMMCINEILAGYGERQFTFDFPVRQAIVIGPTTVNTGGTNSIFHFSYGYTSFYDLSSSNSATNDGNNTCGVGGGSHDDNQVLDTGNTDSNGMTTGDDDNSGSTNVSYAVSTKSYLTYTIYPDRIEFKNSKGTNKNLGFLLILIGRDQYCNSKIVTNNNGIITVDNLLPIKYIYNTNDAAYIPAYLNESRVRLAIVDTTLKSQNSGVGISNVTASTSNLKSESYYDLNVDIDVRRILSFGATGSAYHLRPYGTSTLPNASNVSTIDNEYRLKDSYWDQYPEATCYNSTTFTATGRSNICTSILRPTENNNNKIRFVNLNTSSQHLRTILIMFGI